MRKNENEWQEREESRARWHGPASTHTSTHASTHASTHTSTHSSKKQKYYYYPQAQR
jgi:hypothetical protein